ncbi:MAG: 2-phospho-L-lactate guanylyltransferase [Phototrophicaceae bacterium]
MKLWAIIPVKPLNRAKSRLADVLDSEARAQFAEMMLRRMLKVLQDVPQITGTLVISRDQRALSIARDLGAKTVQESSPSDLNPALTRATEVVRLWGGDAVLILPADLPFITKDDISQIAEEGRYGSTVVIATDEDKDGTNAMLVQPLGIIPYAYGAESYERHVISAKLVGAEVKIYESPTIGLDIDVPADLDKFNERLAENQIEFLTPFLPDMMA